jgi:hypothetical protein
LPLEDGRTVVYLEDSRDGYGYSIRILLPADAPMPSGKGVFTGRFVRVRGLIKQGSPFDDVIIDISASRLLTGASIAGLVVGAMGVFVFTVALRHWLGERRAYRATVE